MLMLNNDRDFKAAQEEVDSRLPDEAIFEAYLDELFAEAADSMQDYYADQAREDELYDDEG